MSRRKICVVTGSRADYGLLYWILKAIKKDPKLKLQIVATGMHLSPEFGLTRRTVESDGFRIDEKVEMLLSSDTPPGIAKSIGLGVIGFADVLDRLSPDILVLLGDRYEIFAAAQAALIAGIPIAHIAGGDTTEGAFDEAIRHSITKMSHIHFVTNEAAEKRVRQLGENPDLIFNVGSPGIDTIRKLKRIGRPELQKKLGFQFRSKNLLVTFHPVTLDRETPADQFRVLLRALNRLGKDVGIVFTKPNADSNGRPLIDMIDDFASGHENAKVFTSLGQALYLGLLAQVDAVVGNSSSGLYEAPSFGIPTVNVGDRQKGRLRASSVIDCPLRTEAVLKAIRKAFTLDCSKVVNPYGDGKSSTRIVAKLKAIRDPRVLVKKHFFDLM